MRLTRYAITKASRPRTTSGTLLAGLKPAIDAGVQPHTDAVPGLFADGFAHSGLHGQHMFAIPHGHERTPERMTIDRGCDLHQPTRAEECDGLRPDDVRPSRLALSFFATWP
jgi:hypothetical protein